jgi:hypothetical protein
MSDNTSCLCSAVRSSASKRFILMTSLIPFQCQYIYYPKIWPPSMMHYVVFQIRLVLYMQSSF